MSMTTHNPSLYGPSVPPTAPSNGELDGASHPAPAPKRVFTTKERVLVGIALALGILADRLLLAPFGGNAFHLPFFSGIFWLGFLAVFYALFWQRLRGNKVLWLVGGLSGLLCIWNFLFDYNSNYGVVTWMVVPAVLMSLAVYSRGCFTLKDAGAIAVDWLTGWFVKPFSAIPMLVGAAGSMGYGGKKTLIKKVLLGIALVLPLLLVLLPLLSSADMVFGYYLDHIFQDFQFSAFLFHLVASLAGGVLLYSFLWNIGYSKAKPVQRKALQIDTLVACIVLGSVLALYTLFCAVQFTYLFAGAGLPEGMTYSEYAREGFAQIIVICGINLLLFGVFLQYGAGNRVVTALLVTLLGLSCVMLVSSFVRLRLYILTYGMTWLRLLSAWFIVYLAAVLALCAVRLLKEQLPLIGVSALLLLGWYTALGYANPDALIMRYNLQANDYSASWIADNRSYIAGMSDDAMLALLDQVPDAGSLPGLRPHENDRHGYSLSSRRLAERRGTAPD